MSVIFAVRAGAVLRLCLLVGSCVVLFACAPRATVTAEPRVDFYFTHDALLERGDVAVVTAQWEAKCVTGGEFADLAASYAPDPRVSADERGAQAAKFDRSAFVRIATDAWRRANSALPQGTLLICVDLAPAADTFTREAMGGVAAVTAGRGRIILRVHPDADWQAALPYSLAHEMHHSYWVQHHYAPENVFTLADYLVFEGRADYFAGTLFEHPAPWTMALDASSHATVWQTVSQNLNATDWETLQAVMFGGPQTQFPTWAGYSMGYRLVFERMAREPALDLKTMTAAPASAFMPVAPR